MTEKKTRELTAQLPDASLRERSGKGWDEWFAVLDKWGGTEHNHTEIARFLVGEHKVDSWSAQSITVGYEQARGMREPGQGPDGYYKTSVSRTIDVPIRRLYEAFANDSLREQWLPEKVVVRGSTEDKSFRADWPDGTRVVAGFVAKGDTKSLVGLQHEKLADAEQAAQCKALWQDRLDALKKFLT